MTLQIVKDALLTVGVPVSHYTAIKKLDKYIVWAEDSSGDTLWADGKMIGQVVQGTIDYFTRTENDSKVHKIQQALTDADISYRLNSIQYEDDTRYIHYEWVWEMD